jgi:hypothetical protein
MTPILDSVKRKGNKFIGGMIFSMVDTEDEVIIDDTNAIAFIHIY